MISTCISLCPTSFNKKDLKFKSFKKRKKIWKYWLYQRFEMRERTKMIPSYTSISSFFKRIIREETVSHYLFIFMSLGSTWDNKSTNQSYFERDSSKGQCQMLKYFITFKNFASTL